MFEDDHLPLVVGIDIGGTATRFVSTTSEGTVVARSRVLTPASLPRGSEAEFFADHVNELLAGRRVSSIGIGASGPIDATGIIRNPDTLPAFSDLDLAGELSSLLSVRCVIDNDAVTGALAEYRSGSRALSSSLLLVTLGTGIGTCLLRNGQPLRGADGWHPEGGHVGVSRFAPCYCGRSSCWEQIASRSALQTAIAARTGADPAGDETSMELYAGRARGGDLAAQDVFDQYGSDVAEGLATLLGLYRPADVVLGGSGARYFSLFESAMDDALARTRLWHAPVTVTATVLDDFGGAIGAAILALDEAGTGN